MEHTDFTSILQRKRKMIVIRVPKDQRDHLLRDKLNPENEVAWWNLPKAPRNLLPNDVIYFQVGDDIIAKTHLAFIHYTDNNVQLFWHPSDGVAFDEPVDGLSGQWRGFRYTDIEHG